MDRYSILAAVILFLPGFLYVLDDHLSRKEARLKFEKERLVHKLEELGH